MARKIGFYAVLAYVSMDYFFIGIYSILLIHTYRLNIKEQKQTLPPF